MSALGSASSEGDNRNSIGIDLNSTNSSIQIQRFDSNARRLRCSVTSALKCETNAQINDRFESVELIRTTLTSLTLSYNKNKWLSDL